YDPRARGALQKILKGSQRGARRQFHCATRPNESSPRLRGAQPMVGLPMAPVVPLTSPQPPRRQAHRPPPRPDPDTSPANFMRAVARIAVALGLNAIEANKPAHEHVRRTWPTDRV